MPGMGGPPPGAVQIQLTQEEKAQVDSIKAMLPNAAEGDILQVCPFYLLHLCSVLFYLSIYPSSIYLSICLSVSGWM